MATLMENMQKAEFRLHRMRSRIWDLPAAKEEQGARVLSYLKKRFLRVKAQVENMTPTIVGKYSGLTRKELARTGTCETDWF